MNLLLIAPTMAFTADNSHSAVELSGGNNVPQNPSLPKLNLGPAAREQVRQQLLTKHTEVEFRLKTTRSAKNFTPKIGAKLPKGVNLDGNPSGFNHS